MLRIVALMIVCAALGTGCASRTQPSSGSESHFLDECDSQSTCADALMCISGVCTAACRDDATCEAIAPGAACVEGRCGERTSSQQLDRDAMIDGALPTDAGTPKPTLGEPVQVAFKAGYFDDEQIWLRRRSGALLKVSSWPVDARRADSCQQSLVGGYYAEGYGRFGALAFDPTGRYLLFIERLACETQDRTRSNLQQVMAYDVVTGRTDTLLTTMDDSSIVSDGGVAVVITRGATGDPSLPPEREVAFYEFSQGALAPIAIPSG